MTQRNDTIHDTEDKSWWLEHGVNLEHRFVELCQTKLSIDACINPEKVRNPCVPDLIVEGSLADLKTQNTPFFTCGRYGLDPRFIVTFNRKDYMNYRKRHPNLVIYFWVDWIKTEWNDKKVDYFGGLFVTPFQAIEQMIEQGAKEHQYIHRQDKDDGNAKSSFMLDVRKFTPIFFTDDRNADILDCMA